MVVRRLAHQGLAVPVVEAPFAFRLVSVYQFGDALQAVEVMFGIGKGPPFFIQDLVVSQVIENVGSGFPGHAHLPPPALPVIEEGGDQAVYSGGDEQAALVVLVQPGHLAVYGGGDEAAAVVPLVGCSDALVSHRQDQVIGTVIGVGKVPGFGDVAAKGEAIAYFIIAIAVCA